ncbi:MAG: 16S rRNA (cytosine(1402)-N(4))-methyltransferase RsmH [Chloroflexota bacterium]|nr:16S rRNA (cytosine(1402)-N(4))-methyltransferase RsmH [Chloroflexota bacterium]MDE2940877.1 16S rRNA (cytosine(1402)-N(4))-methyltransferase RsmH [Chloroflexota bacterium]MDE3268422.1 16S rRNA (cytosine(1402)-N(4))-methyltransferase RsmH [Chloroflexota bacterium]
MTVLTMPYHTPVLVDEAVEGLRVTPGGSYIDCTVGEGGHARAILEAASPEGRLLGIDMDPTALETAEDRLSSYRDFFAPARGNFRDLEAIARGRGFGCVDGILMDLGLSSLQLEGEGRGFSFRNEEPLDMRFDPSQELSAWDVVNHYSQPELAGIFRSYGEEHRAGRIAQAVVENRPIDTALHLAQVVSGVVRRPWSRVHPATQVFQAIRMEVNGELDNLSTALDQTLHLLKPEGRLVVISYHSLEDRLVKGFLRRESREVGALRIVNKKIISPSREEVRFNRRSRSARMRVAERV